MYLIGMYLEREYHKCHFILMYIICIYMFIYIYIAKVLTRRKWWLDDRKD